MNVYLTTKTIQIKPYTIFNSHQLGLEVERPERNTTFSLYSLFYAIKETFKSVCVFSGSIY